MKKKKVFLTLVTISIITVFATACGQSGGDATTEVSPSPTTASSESPESEAPIETTAETPDGTPYIDFTGETLDGTPVALSDYVGSECVVVNFWASWCGPCKSEMAHFYATQEAYKDKGVTFVMVNLTGSQGETKEDAQKYLDDNGLAFDNVIFDTTEEGAIAYNIFSIPTTVFIDKDGNNVQRITGAMSEDMLVEQIDSMIE